VSIRGKSFLSPKRAGGTQGCEEYCTEDEAQLLNELKATGIKVGLLINFGRSKVEFKRMVF
jgi:GxxExxY protein